MFSKIQALLKTVSARKVTQTSVTESGSRFLMSIVHIIADNQGTRIDDEIDESSAFSGELVQGLLMRTIRMCN